jgi:hypothetical protein
VGGETVRLLLLVVVVVLVVVARGRPMELGMVFALRRPEPVFWRLETCGFTKGIKGDTEDVLLAEERPDAESWPPAPPLVEVV